MSVFLPNRFLSIHFFHAPRGLGSGWGMEFRNRSVFAYLGRVEIVASAERRKTPYIQW